MLDRKAWEFLAKGTQNFAPKNEIQVFERAKVKDPEPLIDGVPFDMQNVWKEFNRYYRIHFNKNFERDPVAVKDIEPIFKYFLRDPEFSQSDRVVKQVGNSTIYPALEKGLLIVGSTGNGKTSVLQTFFEMFKSKTVEARECRWNNFKDWDQNRFIYKETADVAIEFSTLQTGEERKNFFKQYEGFRYLFDDLMREKKGNNYGSEIFTDVIAKRYRNKALTHIIMNYTDVPKPEEFSDMSNLEWTLYQISIRYGSHIYDRLFEMFNFIELKGKSMRK